MIKQFLFALSVTGLISTTALAGIEEGKATYDTLCGGCHGTGALNAPLLGEAKDWEARVKKGAKTLQKNAIKGFNAMPAKGGNPALKDSEVKDAVAYMLEALKAPMESEAPVTGAPSTAETTPKVNKSNTFNRLLKGGRGEWNPPPAEDGIHDPDHEETYWLQQPKEAFEGLPDNRFGNHIDWVKALATQAINPRFDRIDPDKKPFVLDLNIVREVKGSMPNVVYPHKQHTEWLDCSNCHPAIFTPKKGANQISMASIIMGQQCGVCHGKVAFPISECRRCHSQKKAITKK